jgi:hypothetical protein
MEKKEQTMRAGWVNDPVHPNGHIYAKMALNLIEKVARATGPQSAAGVGCKRSWSSSNREDRGRTTPTSTGRSTGEAAAATAGAARAAPGSTNAVSAAAGGPAAAGGEPLAAAKNGSRGAAGVAMCTTAVTDPLVVEHTSTAAVAEVPEAMPEGAVPPEEAGTATRRSTSQICW